MTRTTRTPGTLTGETTPEASSLLGASQIYLARGWAPVPIPKGQKAPRIPDWQQLRLSAEQLDDYFHADANVGILLGEPSGGLVDVDIDHEAALRLAHRLPATDRVHGRTKKPNSHHWYQATGKLPTTTRFRDPVTGETLIELRSSGGQTVVPPSVYLLGDGKDHLVWAKDGEPAAIDGTELLHRVAKVAAAAVLAKHYPSTPGSRHDIALALSGLLLRGGMAEQDAAHFVRAVCESAGDEEVEDRVKTVAGTAERLRSDLSATGRHRLTSFFDPRIIDKVSAWLHLSDAATVTEWDAPVPFDEARAPEIRAELLPGDFGAFAKELAEAAEVPESMTVMAVLGAVSAAVNGKLQVIPVPGWNEPVNLYVMVALPPANHKSLVVREAVAPIDGWEFDARLAKEPEVRAAQSRRRTEESIINGFRARAARQKDPVARQALISEVMGLEANLTQVPTLPKVYLNDVTPESLAAAMAEQDGCIAIISDEGGITETLAGLYSSGRANYDVVLKGYDGGRVRLRRKDREYDLTPHIALVLFVQPQVLRNMGQQRAFAGRGFLERILYLVPNSKLGHRRLDTKPVAPATRDAYRKRMRALLDLEIPADAHGNHLPRPLGLSADAAANWAAFRAELEPQLGPEGRLRAIQGWGGKLAGNCLRIAALLHLAEHGPSQSTIQGPTMSAAVSICKALLEHAVAAFQVMQTDEAVHDAEDIYHWIRARGEPRLGRTECLRKFHGRFTKVERYDAALRVLRHHNIVSDVRKERDPATQRLRRYYEVNPLLFDRKA